MYNVKSVELCVHTCTYIILQKELEGALSTVCRQFDVRAYEQVQNAYGILGKTQVHTQPVLAFSDRVYVQ